MTTRLLARARTGEDRGTALLLTLFTMLLVATMSLTVGSAVLMQVKPTQVQQKSTRTLTAAEAGFDVALSRIRAAQDAAGAGVRTKLPCTGTAGASYSGTIGSGSDASAYSVTIRYYKVDPSGTSAAWRSDPNNLVACVSGAPNQVPAFALLESTGTGAKLKSTSAVLDRTVEQVYRFQVTNVNIPGGLIVDNTTPLCLAANAHADGEQVKVTTCDATGTDLKQKWSYTQDLLLQTTSSTGAKFCIQAQSTDGALVKLSSACDEDKAIQVWSFNDIGRFAGATANGSGKPTGTTNGWCLTVLNDKANNSPVVMKKECSGSYDSKHTFNPEAKVGAGAAGDSTNQLVNYRYFGRCFDVTGANRDAKWLIAYPCKQAPKAVNVLWNQKLYWDAVAGKLCTDTSGGTVTNCTKNDDDLYCLYAGTSSKTPASGTRALLKQCSSTDNSQRWTRRFDTGTYGTSYNILTYNGGLCLELNPTGAAEASDYDKQWGVIQVGTCDGSTRQKWNAPPDLQGSTTINTYEHS